MNARRTFAVAKKVLRSVRHDRRSLALMLVAPIIAMTVFGFAFGSEISNTPVAFVNEDAGPAAQRIIGAVDGEAIDVREFGTIAEAHEELLDANVRAVVHFPRNFSESASRGSIYLVFEVDASNAQVTAHVARHLQLAITEAAGSATGAGSPFHIETRAVYADGAEYLDYFVPGIMAFAAMIFTTLLTLLAFVGERTSGTLSRLLVTPVTAGEIVGGYSIAFGLIAMVQGGILLTTALLVFDAMIVGALWIAIVFVVLVAIDAMSLGILLSAAARREAQAIQMIPLVVFPTFLLSGIFVPVETLPWWLRPFAWAIPPTYAVEGLRDVMLRGWGIDRVWPYLAGLAAFGVLFLTLATFGLRRQRVG